MTGRRIFPSCISTLSHRSGPAVDGVFPGFRPEKGIFRRSVMIPGRHARFPDRPRAADRAGSSEPNGFSRAGGSERPRQQGEVHRRLAQAGRGDASRPRRDHRLHRAPHPRRQTGVVLPWVCSASAGSAADGHPRSTPRRGASRSSSTEPSAKKRREAYGSHSSGNASARIAIIGPQTGTSTHSPGAIRSITATIRSARASIRDQDGGPSSGGRRLSPRWRVRSPPARRIGWTQPWRAPTRVSRNSSPKPTTTPMSTSPAGRCGVSANARPARSASFTSFPGDRMLWTNARLRLGRCRARTGDRQRVRADTHPHRDPDLRHHAWHDHCRRHLRRSRVRVIS